ncbi:hypothetical protein AVEN_100062-1 [Araneus ventricosus]|uniref:Uncharacterized protein n=1 Tax=Araneus ventricosus TaxID=182803 RepID=A0A4Y2VVT3_ARAVE|nr:hypothetical protein AVEN_100062-1 [Araneus ventricosus]
MRNTESRYKISRLNKRSLKCRSIQQRDTFPVEMFSATHGVKETPVRHSKFQFPEIGFTKTTEVAFRPFYLPSRSSFLFSLFLNILPSKDRGVVVVLPPGDSSSRWTTHPTVVVCLPSWC